MNLWQYLPSKTTVYHAVGLGLRVYVALLVFTGIYSAFWVAEIAGYLDERVLATLWIAIASMGVVFLVLLIPLYWTSRGSKKR